MTLRDLNLSIFTPFIGADLSLHFENNTLSDDEIKNNFIGDENVDDYDYETLLNELNNYDK
ncbi:hypothetical protein AB3U99_22045 [Niallia sp. JL1B1071]|uniref:hypothetical protein n=1 Tax=Niallia tiangongensis TaxID=3237105 RepID=UPI0037DD2CBF